MLLDAGLAAIYGVTTKRLNEQVKRNMDRFPADFMFQLTANEQESLRSQIATSTLAFSTSSLRSQNATSNVVRSTRGGRRSRPYVFTEHGAIMAASVLNSPLATEMSVYVVRAFVRLRDLLASNKALGQKLEELEHKLKNHDDAIAAILSAIRQLMK